MIAMNASARVTNAVREKRRRAGVGDAWVVDGLAECRMNFLHDKPQPRRPTSAANLNFLSVRGNLL
jgi:hypothetical protein